jgi:hypothetical protein
MNFSIRRIRKKLSSKNHAADAAAELARRGKWIALTSENTAQGKRVRLYWNPKPLLIILASLVVAGYIGCAVALTWWLDRSAFNRVGFADVALPWRWTGLNELRGDGFSDQGIKDLEEGRVQRGIFYLQRGLSLRRDNEEARLGLAKFYADNNYYEGVRRTILPQLDFGFSAPLVRLYIEQAASVEDTAAIDKLIEDWSDHPTVSVEEREWMRERYFRYQMNLGKAEAALLAIDHPSFRGTKWDTMRIVALTRVGRLDEAWALADGLRPDIEGTFPLARRMQAMVLSERGDLPRIRSVFDELLVNGNLAPEAWTFAVEQSAHGNLNELSDEFLRGFFRRFGARSTDVSSLIVRVLGTRNVAMVRKTVELAHEYQALSLNARVMVGLLYISEGEWELLEKDWLIGVEVPTELVDIQRLFHGILAATGADANDEPFLAALNDGRYSLMVYRELTRGFAKAELWVLLKMAAEAGNRFFARSEFFVENLAIAEERLNEFTPDSRVDELMEELTRRYEEEAIPDLRLELLRLVEEENWSDLDAMVRKVRRQRPVWLAEIAAELDDADARAGAAERDFLRLTRLAPTMLRRDGEWEGWFTDQAEIAIEAGEIKLAQALLEAILTETDADSRAGRLWGALIEREEARKAALGEADARASAERRDFRSLIRLAPAMIRRDGEWVEWFTDQAEIAIEAGEGKLARALLAVILTEAESYERAEVLWQSLIEMPLEREAKAALPAN